MEGTGKFILALIERSFRGKKITWKQQAAGGGLREKRNDSSERLWDMTESCRDGSWEQWKLKKEDNQMASVRVTRTKIQHHRERGSGKAIWLLS